MTNENSKNFFDFLVNLHHINDAILMMGLEGKGLSHIIENNIYSMCCAEIYKSSFIFLGYKYEIFTSESRTAACDAR